AVDQRRQERHQMDSPVLSRLCGQPGAAATVRAGLQPGQLSAAGGAAASGASLDIDDAAGETNQDRGKSRAPFREDRLPDGGGGGAARVVPGHSGKDWAAEIGNRDVRMKEETQPSQGNTGNHGGGVFASGRNRACEPKKPCQSVEQAENHKKPPRWSWVGNHMGNKPL